MQASGFLPFHSIDCSGGGRKEIGRGEGGRRFHWIPALYREESGVLLVGLCFEFLCVFALSLLCVFALSLLCVFALKFT